MTESGVDVAWLIEARPWDWTTAMGFVPSASPQGLTGPLHMIGSVPKDFIPIKCRLAEGVVRNAKPGLAHHHLQFAETAVIFP